MSGESPGEVPGVDPLHRLKVNSRLKTGNIHQNRRLFGVRRRFRPYFDQYMSAFGTYITAVSSSGPFGNISESAVDPLFVVQMTFSYILPSPCECATEVNRRTASQIKGHMGLRRRLQVPRV